MPATTDGWPPERTKRAANPRPGRKSHDRPVDFEPWRGILPSEVDRRRASGRGRRGRGSMTTRDDARRGAGNLRPDGLRLESGREVADPRDVDRDESHRGPGTPSGASLSLPERLYAARERKGVDLYRAERDTKIRARYLAALERGRVRRAPRRRLHEGLPPQLRPLPRARSGGGRGPVAARARRQRPHQRRS